jgi:hypothetical protein
MEEFCYAAIQCFCAGSGMTTARTHYDGGILLRGNSLLFVQSAGARDFVTRQFIVICAGRGSKGFCYAAIHCFFAQDAGGEPHAPTFLMEATFRNFTTTGIGTVLFALQQNG